MSLNMQKAALTFWGVRGSTAAAMRHGTRYGGNTSCVQIVSGSTRLILDAGTGIRLLGESMVKRGEALDATLLLSHYHRDHLDGLPFFLPLYKKAARLNIYAPASSGKNPGKILSDAISPPFFPVPFKDIPAKIIIKKVPKSSFGVGCFNITPLDLSHPGGSLGWRITGPEKKSIIYISDNEPDKNAGELIKQIRGADILIHDAQYSVADYKRKIGWGHSPYIYPIYLAMQAGVKRLILTHFDPTYTDRMLDALEADSKDILKNCGYRIRCELAREGMRVQI